MVAGHGSGQICGYQSVTVPRQTAALAKAQTPARSSHGSGG